MTSTVHVIFMYRLLILYFDMIVFFIKCVIDLPPTITFS
jgi:hypothetical protein